MEADKRDIKNMLIKSPARLKRVCEWCRIYSTCGQMNDMMIQNNGQLGDDEVSRKKK